MKCKKCKRLWLYFGIISGWKIALTWKIEFDVDVEKDLKKLGHTAQKRIINYLKEKISPAEDPRLFGKPLSGDLKWITF